MNDKKTSSSYKRTVLFQTEAFEIVSCEWSEGDISPMHGHGWSQCYALVENGFFENTTDSGIKRERLIKETGQVIQTQVGARHEIKCLSPRSAPDF